MFDNWNQEKPLQVFTIAPRQNTKDFWREIGSAFRAKNGSLTVVLDALPVNGRLNICERKDWDKDEGAPPDGQ